MVAIKLATEAQGGIGFEQDYADYSDLEGGFFWSGKRKGEIYFNL